MITRHRDSLANIIQELRQRGTGGQGWKVRGAGAIRGPQEASPAPTG